MTKQDLKHALISLVLGVLTMATMQFLEGFFKILNEWIIGTASGVVSSATYLKYKHFL